MLNPLGDVAGGLESVVKVQMAWEECRGLPLSSWMLSTQISLKKDHYRLSDKMSSCFLQDVLIILQDPLERNRGDLEGGVVLREGECWDK